MGDATIQAKVYHTQGASAMFIDAGGTLDASSGAVVLPPNLRTGHIPLGSHLFNARQLASAEAYASGTSAESFFWGGVLTNKTTPALSINSTADQTAYLSYASGVVTGIKLPPIALPPDLSSAAGITIGLYGESVGSATAADAISAIQVKAWNGLGGADLGSTHPNFTTTPSWKEVTIASGSVVAGAPLNINLVPQAHAGRAINLYDMRLRYTRTTS